MRVTKKGLAVTMSLALVVSSFSFQPAQAAKKLKLNKTKATIKVGSKVKITVKNAKKKTKVKWKTSKKKVAKITKKKSKGKKPYATVKGMKKGTAKITATYKKGKKNKKLTCKVTVKAKGTNKPTPSQGSNTPNPPSQKPGGPTAVPTDTPVPTPTIKPTMQPSTQNYAYFNDYTLGYKGKVVAYKDGKSMALSQAGTKAYNLKEDDIFGQHIENNNWWEDKITLTQPIRYTTNDGVAHDVDSMLTNFNFIADPTAIDNSANDGKLYVYGTTEGIDYSKGKLAKNGYNNHSLTILSTKDMVNWTDEGTLDNKNLTNQVSTAASKDKVKNKWGTKAWAPSGLKIDGDGDGEDEYYIFYTNGGAVGYVQGDSPTGPWKDDLGTTLFNRETTPNCEGVVWCFDPAVLVDKKGDAYVYFGGGTNNDKAHGKTARVCKIKFEEGTGKVLLDGEPQELDNYYMFEDSEINQFGDKYFYSYCTNFDVPSNDKWIRSGEIAAYVSSDPMNISFAPDEKGDKWTGDDGVYHHYLGTILDNPSVIYGESYNNHHHMQEFKGHYYMLYHSTVLSNTLFRDSKQYRNLHVDEIDVNTETDEIKITPTYEGASQIEDFEPFKNPDGTPKYINATTSAKSAGVKSTRDDVMVKSSINGSPMVIDSIDTGDWTCIKGVNFGTEGLKNFGVEYNSELDAGRIELFIDSPTKLENKVGYIDIMEPTNGRYVFKNVNTTKTVTGKHDIYFVFRGSGYKVASWILSQEADAKPPVVDRPDEPTTPTTPPVTTATGWNADKTEYVLDLSEEYVQAEGGASVDYNDDKTVTITYNPQYPGAWFIAPDNVSEKFSTIEFTYKDATDKTPVLGEDGNQKEDENGPVFSSFGSAVRYSDSTDDEEINWGGKCPAGEGLQTQSFDLDSSREFLKYKIFRNDCEDCLLTITSVKLKK